MPTYVYKFVDTGETIEVQQAFTDDALTEVDASRLGSRMLPVKKVFTPVGVTFKGGGFYKTDSRGKSSTSEPVVVEQRFRLVGRATSRTTVRRRRRSSSTDVRRRAARRRRPTPRPPPPPTPIARPAAR